MNKLQFLALSALVVTAGVSATSCSSDEVVVENNPTFDGKAVKTDFAINIPVAGGKASRQSVEVTQAETGPVFKGMKNIFLASTVDATPGAASTFTSIFRLPEIMKASADIVDAANSAKIYNNVEVPVGTKGFVFYGESAYEGITAADADEDFEKGVLVNNISEATMKTADIKFNLKSIVADVTTLNTNKGTLTTALNSVLAVSGWQTFAATPDATGDPADDTKLKKLYKKLATAGTKYLGSAPAIKGVLEDLQNSVNSLRDASLSATATPIKAALQGQLTTSIAAVSALVPAAAPAFPMDLGLPEGALQIEYNAGTNTYSYVDNAAVTIGNAAVPTAKISFPASLNYTVATNAKANNNKVTWDENLTAWVKNNGTYTSQFTTANGWGDAVTAATRSVALEKSINYSVARLDVSAKLKDANGLPDNTAAHVTGAGNQIINSGQFQVTGIIIGGQPTQADWQVLPAASDDYSQVIYDRAVINGNQFISTTAQPFCKTLVLDNRKGDVNVDVQKDVHVALEVKNGSGVDFWGLDGVIKAGVKFYLVAKLTPTTTPATPGLTIAQNGKKHVFVQDHVTKVVFTLSSTSLPKAYVGVPDLRSSDLELGLAVDLEWQRGMEFEVEF